MGALLSAPRSHGGGDTPPGLQKKRPVLVIAACFLLFGLVFLLCGYNLRHDHEELMCEIVPAYQSKPYQLRDCSGGGRSISYSARILVDGSGGWCENHWVVHTSPCALSLSPQPEYDTGESLRCWVRAQDCADRCADSWSNYCAEFLVEDPGDHALSILGRIFIVLAVVCLSLPAAFCVYKILWMLFPDVVRLCCGRCRKRTHTYTAVQVQDAEALQSLECADLHSSLLLQNSLGAAAPHAGSTGVPGDAPTAESGNYDGLAASSSLDRTPHPLVGPSDALWQKPLPLPPRGGSGDVAAASLSSSARGLSRNRSTHSVQSNPSGAKDPAFGEGSLNAYQQALSNTATSLPGSAAGSANNSSGGLLSAAPQCGGATAASGGGGSSGGGGGGGGASRGGGPRASPGGGVTVRLPIRSAAKPGGAGGAAPSSRGADGGGDVQEAGLTASALASRSLSPPNRHRSVVVSSEIDIVSARSRDTPPRLPLKEAGPLKSALSPPRGRRRSSTEYNPSRRRQSQALSHSQSPRPRCVVCGEADAQEFSCSHTLCGTCVSSSPASCRVCSQPLQTGRSIPIPQQRHQHGQPHHPRSL